MDGFILFINKYHHIDHPFGDLAEDIQKDPDFPRTDSFGEIFDYLNVKRASEECINTFIEAWAAYRRHPEDQTALCLSQLMDKIDSLTEVTGRIAEALEILADIQNIENPLASIADDIEELREKADQVIYHSDLGDFVHVGGRVYTA